MSNKVALRNVHLPAALTLLQLEGISIVLAQNAFLAQHLATVFSHQGPGDAKVHKSHSRSMFIVWLLLLHFFLHSVFWGATTYFTFLFWQYIHMYIILLGSWIYPTKDHHPHMQSAILFVILRLEVSVPWCRTSNTKAKMVNGDPSKKNLHVHLYN